MKTDIERLNPRNNAHALAMAQCARIVTAHGLTVDFDGALGAIVIEHPQTRNHVSLAAWTILDPDWQPEIAARCERLAAVPQGM